MKGSKQKQKRRLIAITITILLKVVLYISYSSIFIKQFAALFFLSLCVIKKKTYSISPNLTRLLKAQARRVLYENTRR